MFFARLFFEDFTDFLDFSDFFPLGAGLVENEPTHIVLSVFLFFLKNTASAFERS